VPYGLSLRTAPWIAWSMFEYLLFRRGLLANNIMHAGGFVKTSQALDRPDVQFILEPGSRSKEGKGGYGHGYGLVTVVLHPKSRGRVTLASPDFRAAPDIDFGFLSDQADVDLAALAVRLARRLLEADAFAPYRGIELQPGPRIQSDHDLESFVRNNAGTGFHAAGSCRMGSDSGAVVDAELKVIGIDGLRVVDASVMPTLVGGNPNSAVIMIAEKASDMIMGKAPLAPEITV
jgi:choline dehydrogenase-like flavoprotein